MNYIIYIVLIIPIFGVISAGVMCWRDMMISRKMQAINSLINQICWDFNKQDIWTLKQEYLNLKNEFTELKDKSEKYSYKQIFDRFSDIEIKLNEIKEVLFYLSSVKGCYDNAKCIVENNSNEDPVVLGYLEIIKAKYAEACTIVIYNGYNNQLNKLKLIMECAVRQLNLVRIGVYL